MPALKCPYCSGVDLRVHVKPSRYRCKKCDRTFTLNPKKRGAKPLGKVAMTQAELSRRWRNKNKENAMNNTLKLHWDEEKQCWMVDDFGRARQATPEEIETHLAAMDSNNI